MAGGSQHVIQIMATQTCFDLNAALENWRNELAAQPQLTPDDQRELEKHLADVMAELRQRGLNEEESYWLARRRIGQPEKIAEEFQKADIAGVWRERVFWVWLFIFLWRVSEVIINSVIGIAVSPLMKLHFYGAPEAIISIALSMLPFLVPLVFVVLLARGKLIPQLSKLMPVIEDRRRFVTATFGLVLLSYATRAIYLIIFFESIRGPRTQGAIFWITNFLLPTVSAILMGAVLIWLRQEPSQKQQMERPA
jgi:hypothetical protein